MDITNKKIPHNYRNKYLKNTSSGGFFSTSNTSAETSGLPFKYDEDGNYIVNGTITFKGNVLSTGEVCAYAENNPKYEGVYSPLKHAHSIAEVDNLQNILDSLSGETSTKISIIDNLDSTATDNALSANQGRALKQLIDNKSSISTWDELLNKPSTFPPSEHEHNDKYYSKSEVDTKIDTKETGLPYTIDEDGNYIVDGTITFKGNVLSTGEVCAYAENNPKYEGVYSPLKHAHSITEVDNLQNILDSLSNGTGTKISIVDNLESTATDSALSANQGRLLKGLIDNKSSISTWDELLNKPSTFTPSEHEHNDKYYSKSEVDNQLSSKSNNGHAHDERYYSKSEVDNQLSSKSNNGHSHDERYYSKSEVDNQLSSKSNNGHGHNVNEISNAMPHSYFHWSGQGGQPTWLWGGNSSDAYFVYNPANFRVSNANTIADYPHTSIPMYRGWIGNPGANANDASNDISFSYSNNCPNTGALVTFDPGRYSLQFSSSYWNSNLSMRTKNGDYNTWNAWTKVLTDNDWTSTIDGRYLPLTGGTITGNILATGEITAYSDIRLKSDIKKLKNRGRLNPITYTKEGKESIGFIAQEVQKIYPELVIEETTENKYLSLNYAQLTAVLAAQINELSDEVNDLKKQIKELNSKQ